MSKKTQKLPLATKRHRGNQVRASSPAHGVAARIAALKHLTGWRLWAVNLATAILFPTLLMVLVEGSLRLGGYGYPTAFCLRQPGKDGAAVYIENDRFLWQFYSKKTNLRPNPFAVAVPKPANTVRILILGESAAAGTPDPAYNFGRCLDRMLRKDFPQQRIEVINAAMRGVNSHILLPVARDCLRLEPDLMIVYMGNNEAVGLYAPGPRSGRLTSHIGLLRLVQNVRATRLGQLLEPLLFGLDREGVVAEDQDDTFFLNHRVAANDSRRAAVYRNFRSNLEAICDSASRAGCELVLMSVAVNLDGCPPFGSLHRSGISGAELARWESVFAEGVRAEASAQFNAALTNYLAALNLDDHFAELHFRLGQCHQVLGQTNAARQQFILARDWDALQFRTDSRLNDIIRQIAAGRANRSVRLVDCERSFAESSRGGVGAQDDQLFSDHVHLTFEGDYRLASSLLPAVRETVARKLTKPIPPTGPSLSIEECEARLAFTRVNQAQLARTILQMSTHPPFTLQFDHVERQKAAESKLVNCFGNINRQDLNVATETYRAALSQFPDDWFLAFNFARLELSARQFEQAIPQFETAQRLLPHWPPIRIGLAAALSGCGRHEEALQLLRHELVFEPQSRDIQAGITRIETQMRRPRGSSEVP